MYCKRYLNIPFKHICPNMAVFLVVTINLVFEEPEPLRYVVRTGETPNLRAEVVDLQDVPVNIHIQYAHAPAQNLGKFPLASNGMSYGQPEARN